MRLRQLSDKTTVVLVFDTDVEMTDILRENLRILQKEPRVKQIWCVLQVKKFEDEIVRSTDVNAAKDLLDCSSGQEFKHSFIKEKRLFQKLQEHHFSYDLLWVQPSPAGYKEISNDGWRIKL